MAFNQLTKKKILRDRKTDARFPCVMCGTTFPLPDAAHIIDEKEWKSKKGVDRQLNGIPLCPNCHRVFEEVLRPYLYRSLKEFGATGLPACWETSNKVSKVTNARLPLDESS
jgi:hypothetical protein